LFYAAKVVKKINYPSLYVVKKRKTIHVLSESSLQKPNLGEVMPGVFSHDYESPSNEDF
jgi:hypothetical protein